MKLKLNFSLDNTIGHSSKEYRDKLLKQFSESCIHKGITDFSNNSMEKLLKIVETNKDGLYGQLKLWPGNPELENTVALISLFNEYYNINNDLRYLNTSLKLLTLISNRFYSELSLELKTVLNEEYFFVREVEI